MGEECPQRMTTPTGVCTSTLTKSWPIEIIDARGRRQVWDSVAANQPGLGKAFEVLDFRRADFFCRSRIILYQQKQSVSDLLLPQFLMAGR